MRTLAPKRARPRRHALVVGGDHDALRDNRAMADAFVDVLEHRFGGDAGESFSGETARSEPGRNNAQDFAARTSIPHANGGIVGKSRMLYLAGLDRRSWQWVQATIFFSR